KILHCLSHPLSFHCSTESCSIKLKTPIVATRSICGICTIGFFLNLFFVTAKCSFWANCIRCAHHLCSLLCSSFVLSLSRHVNQPFVQFLVHISLLFFFAFPYCFFHILICDKSESFHRLHKS
ncbi:hypothetical protein Tcan_00596, partial [Toxocara canis]